jgi:hypothetical protein
MESIYSYLLIIFGGPLGDTPPSLTGAFLLIGCGVVGFLDIILNVVVSKRNPDHPIREN